MSLNVEKASREEVVQAFLAASELGNALEKSNTALQQENTKLKERLAWWERQYFGSKAERYIPQDPRQVSLLEVPETAPPETTTVKSYERSSRPTPTKTEDEGKLRFGRNVPVEEEVVWPDKTKGLSEDEFEVIGEKVTQRLKQIPCSYVVKRTIRKTVKLKSNSKLHTAPAPDAIIDRSYADVSLLAGLLVDKFQFHLPLYRQHQRMELSDVHVSRANLTNLVHRSLEILEPIYLAILSEISLAETICIDETPIKAGRKAPGRMRTAYFWPFFADNQVAFIYSRSRGHEVIKDFVSDNCKKILSDGHSAYKKFASLRDGLVSAQCWAHARRKFDEAKDKSPPECEKVLGWIQDLFMIERELKGKELIEIGVGRRLNSAPIVDEYFEYLNKLWYEQHMDKVSLLGQAIQYSLNREQGLKEFLEHPDIPISNNGVERLIKPGVIGRKNWLFCWTEVGARFTAIAYTLVQNCILNGVKPWDYFNDVLVRINEHPARKVHQLAPKYWKQISN